jgi:GDP/UDP-N,N'-diacetylbacillosamine 2-epimerase (hydrolysing)
VKRRVCYVTGSRADFGLVESTLRMIAGDWRMDLDVIVTGMHLEEAYGRTAHDVERAGLRISRTIPAEGLDGTGLGMARGIASMLRGLSQAWAEDRPDIVLVLGDRGEALAAALGAAHLDIPVAHVHGGERSGTIDESVRHATSKLAHLHLVATEDSRLRLQRMGERPDRVWVTGAPGLDGLRSLASLTRRELCVRYGFEEGRPISLMAYHPVLQDRGSLGAVHATRMVESLSQRGFQTVALAPNSDAGGPAIREALRAAAERGTVRLEVHVPRRDFVSLMAHADVMIGNSSAGIIEAATFGTPVVNVGDRQAMRQRNPNVIDSGAGEAELAEALGRALAMGRSDCRNVYGDGQAGPRIAEILASVDLGSGLTRKCNAT